MPINYANLIGFSPMLIFLWVVFLVMSSILAQSFKKGILITILALTLKFI